MLSQDQLWPLQQYLPFTVLKPIKIDFVAPLHCEVVTVLTACGIETRLTEIAMSTLFR